MQQGVQTDATCNIQQCCVLLRGALEYLHFCLSKALCKRTQHCWMLLVASVCTACCMLLRVVLLGVVAFVFTPLKHATLLAQQYWELFPSCCVRLYREGPCCSVVNDNACLHLLQAHEDPRSTLCNWLFNRQFENENSHSLKRFDKCVQSETVVPLSPKNENKKKVGRACQNYSRESHTLSY